MTSEAFEGLPREVLEGTREARLLAASGLLPMAPADLIPLQVHLAGSADQEIAQKAAGSLAALEPRIAANLVEEGTRPEVLSYLGDHLRHPVVLEAIVRNRSTPPAILGEVARVAEPEIQELVLLRQDVITEHPDILVDLERNPLVTAFTKRRINEYREHLLPRDKRPQKSRLELEADADAITEEELVEAIEEVREAIPAEGEKDDAIGLTDSQVRTLPIPIRLKLTRGASKGLRNILIKDPNPMVATSVLKNNPLNELEAEHIANNRSVIPEVLDAIAKTRNFIRRYSIVLALVKNPRTPAGLAARLVPRLSVRDMQGLARDRNVANAVRSTAKRLYRMKKS